MYYHTLLLWFATVLYYEVEMLDAVVLIVLCYAYMPFTDF